MKSPPKNIFEWLEQMRGRPGMFLRNNMLEDLETLVNGYCACLTLHNVIEAAPSMGRHFHDWLWFKTQWSDCCGWAELINREYPESQKALEAFFVLVDEYRQLVPTILCSITLGAGHNPTGRRVIYGLNPDFLMEKPIRVEIIRYYPGRFHFHRFHYRDRVFDDGLLTTSLGVFETSLDDAKQWMLEEFQVDPDDWEEARSSQELV